MSMMPPPQQGQTPKQLMQLLATLMLNSRLRQHRPAPRMAPPPQMNQGGDRMAQLARMSLNMDGRQGPPSY